jgi:hypothetical protein
VIIPVEGQFRFRAIIKESRTNARALKEQFEYHFKTLREIVDCQSRLTGIFFHEVNLKRIQDFAYKDNLLLNNTLFNLPYRSFSILLLVENSMYGAARPILRQSFEQMIIAKQSELDSGLATRWHNQDRIGAGEVLARLKQNGKDISALSKFWDTLNRVTHPTREAMQPLLIPQDSEPTEIEPWFLRVPHQSALHDQESLLIGLSANSMFTLDMLYVILGMNLHLLVGHLGKKARGYFPSTHDPEDVSEHEKMLKRRARTLLSEYSDRIPVKARGYFKRVVYQFRQDWEPPRRQLNLRML